MPFEATLFNPATGDSVKVSVRSFGSSLEVTGAGEALRIDPAKSELGAGGWDRESIQITWPGEGGTFALTTKDPGAKDELARIPRFHGALGQAVRAQAAARRSGRFGLTMVVVLTLLPVLLLVGLLVFRNRIVDFVLERIPITVDQQVGRMFEEEILGGKEAVKDNEATRAIDLIVDRLAAASPEKRFEFKVAIQRNREVNAFAAPGGLIVVYTGLIQEAGSAEEVAGVLAHEMAHATNRHSMRQLVYAGGLLPLMGLEVFEDSGGGRGPDGFRHPDRGEHLHRGHGPVLRSSGPGGRSLSLVPLHSSFERRPRRGHPGPGPRAQPAARRTSAHRLESGEGLDLRNGRAVGCGRNDVGGWGPNARGTPPG